MYLSAEFMRRSRKNATETDQQASQGRPGWGMWEAFDGCQSWQRPSLPAASVSGFVGFALLATEGPGGWWIAASLLRHRAIRC